MFHSVPVKQECMKVEGINTSDEINASTTTEYSNFTQEDFEYKYSQLPEFWSHEQITNKVQSENIIHDQNNLYQVEENNSLAYMRNSFQNSTTLEVNQGESLNKINPQCHIYKAQKSEQLEIFPNVQTVKVPNQMVKIPGPKLSIKPKHCGGRPSKYVSKLDTGNKPKYQCEICFKEFTHASNLLIHKRIHKGERPYKCTQCEKSFTHSGNLAIHMRIHSGERPYGCQICGKRFSHSGNLSTHLRTHSGVKPYKCTICGKEFRHSGNVSSHERIHSGIRPYQCNICGKNFRHRGNLSTHMKKHTRNLKTSSKQYKNDKK